MRPVNTKPVLEHEVELRERLVRLRRQIHANPEYGFREIETAALIARTTRELGANVREGVAKTGVIAELGTGSPIVAIRADMDALPINETTGLEFASQVPNMAATEVLGADHVVEMPFDTWAEDFGFMTARVPGSMFWLGVTSNRVPKPIWHSSTFDLDEDSLPVGAMVLAASARRLLQQAAQNSDTQ